MDPLALILVSIAVLLAALHLMTRRSVTRTTRASRNRAFRFARLAVRTWLQHQRGQVSEEPGSLLEAAQLIRAECRSRGIAEPQVVQILLMPEGLPRLEALANLTPTEELNSVEIPPTLDPDRPSYEGVTDAPEVFDLPAALRRAATSQ